VGIREKGSNTSGVKILHLKNYKIENATGDMVRQYM
jgi:hypothetical protein